MGENNVVDDKQEGSPDILKSIRKKWTSEFSLICDKFDCPSENTKTKKKLNLPEASGRAWL